VMKVSKTPDSTLQNLASGSSIFMRAPTHEAMGLEVSIQ